MARNKHISKRSYVLERWRKLHKLYNVYPKAYNLSHKKHKITCPDLDLDHFCLQGKNIFCFNSNIAFKD